MAKHNDNLPILAALERKVLWLASWMIHNANHLRENADGLKVGGHQASSASLATIMTALYFDVLKPTDRVAVKPHASPIFHAIQYLLGKQTRERMEAFRGYKGAQSYPSRTKDIDDVDFSTGSVGLGVAQTLFASLVQDYVRAHGWGLSRPEGRMIALAGDAELDEGNIFEALLEGFKHGVRNTWWIIDYNRQSLDAVIREGLYARFESLFRAFGWEVVTLKYGSLLEAAFREPGGESLREWIDRYQRGRIDMYEAVPTGIVTGSTNGSLASRYCQTRSLEELETILARAAEHGGVPVARLLVEAAVYSPAEDPIDERKRFVRWQPWLVRREAVAPEPDEPRPIAEASARG